MQTRHLIHATLFLSAFSLQAFRLFSQQIPQPRLANADALATTGTTKLPAATTTGTGAANTKEGEEVVQMDTFRVDADQDEGYGAANTTSGSGINTPLRDVAASISTFTPEFLADIGAATVEDLLNYAGNAEMDVGDGDDAGMNIAYTRNADDTPQFRLRGINGSVLTDGVESITPTDQYNTDRTEIASGANSILFGMGAQGGVVASSSKEGRLQRNTLKIQSYIGTWDSPGVTGIPYQRFTMDYNLVLIPKRMALRLNGLYENSKSWRVWEYRDSKRLNPVITAKPWKNTKITIGAESGRVQNSVSRPYNASDGYTRWANVGRPLMQGFGPAYAVAQTGTIASASTDYLVYNQNDGILYNYRQAYETPQWSSHPLSQDLAPYEYSTIGPGAGRDQKFSNASVRIEQTIGNLNLEFRYNYSTIKAQAISPQQQRGWIQADPNALVSPALWVSSDAPYLVQNDYQGRLYMEQYWFKDTRQQTVHTFQLNANYNLNLKKWGRHRIIANYEFSRSDIRKDQLREILVDDDNVAFSSPDTPEATANRIERRFYLTEGDFSTYHEADPTIPISFSIGDQVLHNAWVTGGPGFAAHIKKNANAFKLTLQSYWLNDRLSTIFGLRYDIVDFNQEYPQYRVTLPAADDLDQTVDPRITSKQVVANEYAFDGQNWRPGSYNPVTFTAGGVYHLGKRSSLSANYSTNRGLPILDGRSTLPDGKLPPLTEGTTFDFGVRYDFFGNGKLVASLTRFDSRQLKNASFVPDGTNSLSSSSLGSNNLFNIFDALYFLTPTSQTGIPNPARAPYGAYVGAGPMPQSMYAVNAPVSTDPKHLVYPNGFPPLYSAGLVDTVSSGYELEITGRPMKNVDVRLTFSYSDRSRENIMNEIFDYYNKNIPVWMALAKSNNPNDPDGIWYVITNNTGAKTPLTDYIWSQLYGSSGVRDSLAAGMLRQTGRFGNRPYKGNLTIRYTFSNTIFKGLAVAASGRYRSANYLPDPNRMAPDLAAIPSQDDYKFAFDPNRYYNVPTMIRGQDTLFFDLMLRYKYKLFGGRTTMTLQMNLNNLANTNQGGVARWNKDGSVNIRYLPNPRAYRLTATFDF